MMQKQHWVITGLLVLVAILATWLVTSHIYQTPAPVVPAQPSPQAPGKPPAPVQAQFGLNDVFKFEMLRAQIAYLEAHVGPAKSIDGDGSRHYTIDGCEVTVGSNGKEISSLRLDLSPSCTIDVTKFPGFKGAPSANQWTFGTMTENTGIMPPEFLADCLQSCGNAYDPSVYMHYTGPHANDWLETVVGAKLVTDQIIGASGQFQKAMAAEGDDYIVDAKFNCDRKYDALAGRIFKDVKVEFIEFGNNLEPVGTCKKP